LVTLLSEPLLLVGGQRLPPRSPRGLSVPRGCLGRFAVQRQPRFGRTPRRLELLVGREKAPSRDYQRLVEWRWGKEQKNLHLNLNGGFGRGGGGGLLQSAQLASQRACPSL
jgi:hypothetical protein